MYAKAPVAARKASGVNLITAYEDEDGNRHLLRMPIGPDLSRAEPETGSS